jgi:hypothetical protein
MELFFSLQTCYGDMVYSNYYMTQMKKRVLIHVLVIFSQISGAHISLSHMV